MEEPFDELMGPTGVPQRGKIDTSYPPSVVSPDTSPTATVSTAASTPSSTQSSRRSGSRGPPSAAFANNGPSFEGNLNNLTPDRWNSFEKDPDALDRDRIEATGRACVIAAEKAADRATPDDDDDDDYYSYSQPVSTRRSTSGSRSSFENRLNSGGASLPHPEQIRAGSSSSSSSTTLSKSFNFRSNRKTRRASSQDESIVYETADKVRADALKLLEAADSSSPYSVRQTVTGGFTMDPPAKKRTPAALAGIDMTGKARPPRAKTERFDKRFSIMSDSDGAGSEGEDDLIDVHEMESRALSMRSKSYTDGTKSATTGSWSSRYTVGKIASSNLSAKQILEKMDRKEQARLETSARNMFRSSPHSIEREQQTVFPKVFGSNFSFNATKFFSPKKEPATDPKSVNLQAHKTVWMDVDINTNNGNSLPPPPVSTKNRAPKSLEDARKRRRLCLAGTAIVLLVFLAATLLGVHHDKLGGDKVAVATINDNTVHFYVTANAPYNAGEENKLVRDFRSVDTNADFVVHLGNIQDSSVTLCPTSSYIAARAIFEQSLIPVLVLPGRHDWNNCPVPGVAFGDWQDYLGQFEEKFNLPFVVKRQLGNEENFSILLDKGVLVVGLHLVGGKIHNREEFRVRHERNVRWVEEELAKTNPGKYRALVLLGNAKPSPVLQDFFDEVLDDVRSIGKPTIYLHSDEAGEGVQVYQPFSDTSNLHASAVRNGGANPPVSVMVGEGPNPFIIS